MRDLCPFPKKLCTVIVTGVAAAALLMLAPSALAATWSGAVTVSSSGEAAYPFSRVVATDAGGDSVVAWTRVSNASGGTWDCPCTVRAAYRPAGGAFGAPVDISPTVDNPDDAQLSVHVAMDAAGDAIVAYSAPGDPTDTNELPDTAYASIRPAGGSFGAPTIIDSPGGNSGAGLAGVEGLVMDAAGDAAALIGNEQAYTGAGGTGTDDVFDSEVVTRPAGGAFDSAHPKVLSDGTHDSFPRAIAMSPNGKTAVLMRTDVDDQSHPLTPQPNSVQVAVAGSPGGSFGTPTTLEIVTASTFAGYPMVDASPNEVAIDDAGEYAVEYQRWADSSTAKARASLNGGSPVDISPASVTFAGTGPVVMNPGGEALAFWNDTNGNAFFNTRPAGGTFGAPASTPSSGVGFDTVANATNVESANGDVLDVFDAVDSSGTQQVDASIRPPGGSFSAPDAISPANDDPFAFGVIGAIDGIGDAVAAWTDGSFAVRAAVTGSLSGGGGGGGGGASGSGGTNPHPGTSGTAPRPNTKLLKKAINRRKRQAKFWFKGSVKGSKFQCALVKQAKKKKGHRKPKPKFASCRSPRAYKHLAHGRYTFYVRASKGSARDLSPVSVKFRL